MFAREQMAARFEANRDMLRDAARASRDEFAQRADEIREKFAESVTVDTVTNAAGWTLVSAGVAWGVTDWMRGRRRVRNLVFPLALMVLGTTMLSGGRAWQRRGMHIDEAETRVREEIGRLDPFARMRVLRDVAGETVPLIRRISSRN
jgi:hypothetical protein